MFYHRDLDLYRNNNFRSLKYLENIWRIVEFDIIFIVGMTNSGNITINIDSDCVKITATSNFNHIFDKKHQIDFNHSLVLCYDFVCDITLKITGCIKPFYFDVLNCKFYYDKTSTSDEGFIECSISSNVKVSNLEMFKLSFFSLLSRELQFVINKNVFLLDIEKKDLIESDIDSLYELINTISVINNSDFFMELKKINISHEDKKIIQQLKIQLEKI